MRMILKMYILDRGVLCLRFIQNKNLTWMAYLLNNLNIYALVAQLDRALPSGGKGRGFESLQAHF